MEHQLAIAFLNSGEAFENPMTAATWWGSVRNRTQAALAVADDAKPRFDSALAARLRALREASARAISGTPSPADLEALTAALSCATLRLSGDPPALAYAVAEPAGAVLFPLAFAVAGLIGADRTRLRTCACAGCSAYFWDVTKNGSRRWCSLRCMERVRAPRRRLQR